MPRNTGMNKFRGRGQYFTRQACTYVRNVRTHAEVTNGGGQGSFAKHFTSVVALPSDALGDLTGITGL